MRLIWADICYEAFAIAAKSLSFSGMANRREPKPGKSDPDSPLPSPGDDQDQAWHGVLSRENLEALSTLQLLDLIASKVPGQRAVLLDLVYLRERLSALEEMNDQAREALEKFEEIVAKLRSPAFRIGTFLGVVEKDQAHVAIGGTEYVCRVDPKVIPTELSTGQRVLCNEAFAVVGAFGFDAGGPIARVEDLLSEGRIRLVNDTGLAPIVVCRSALLAKEKLKPGHEVRLDPSQRVALEVVGTSKRIDRSLESVSVLPWSSIGGQEEAVRAIRDAIELPYLHRDLFRRFEHSIPKGFLLHGPPGCGKTLLGKATAYNLREQIRTATGVERPQFFLHVKGPEILNMWVGESERQVRDLFAQCRERAVEGALAFLFIDEAESILGTRRGSRSQSILSTLVPMFCTEMDGLEPLQNVVVILASNRADLIDPAILRPGRIDRKIRVRRPDREGAEAIYRIYLKEGIPLAETAASLAAGITERHYARTQSNEFLEVTYRSGRRDVLYRGDLNSGAVIAAVVERAKALAIQRSIDTRTDSALGRDDLFEALSREYSENDLFPTTEITEDWLKLTDFDPESVVRLGPIRQKKAGAPSVV